MNFRSLNINTITDKTTKSLSKDLSLILISLLFNTNLCLCQESSNFSLNPTSDTALLEVQVKDFDKNALKREKILFIDTVNQKKFSGITNKNGILQVLLPGGKTYKVKIKEISNSKEYTLITFPELGEGQVYRKSTLDIKYQSPEEFTLNNIYFDFNKAHLKEQSYKELNDLLEFLNRKDNVKIEIAGHTDNIGSQINNKRLSEKRASAVKKYLVKQGILSERIKTKGYGKNRPVAPNNTKEGRQKNRRVEVHILEKNIKK